MNQDIDRRHIPSRYLDPATGTVSFNAEPGFVRVSFHYRDGDLELAREYFDVGNDGPTSLEEAPDWWSVSVEDHPFLIIHQYPPFAYDETPRYGFLFNQDEPTFSTIDEVAAAAARTAYAWEAYRVLRHAVPGWLPSTDYRTVMPRPGFAAQRSLCGSTAPHEAHATGLYEPGKPAHHGFAPLHCEGAPEQTKATSSRQRETFYPEGVGELPYPAHILQGGVCIFCDRIPIVANERCAKGPGTIANTAEATLQEKLPMSTMTATTIAPLLGISAFERLPEGYKYIGVYTPLSQTPNLDTAQLTILYALTDYVGRNGGGRESYGEFAELIEQFWDQPGTYCLAFAGTSPAAFPEAITCAEACAIPHQHRSGKD